MLTMSGSVDITFETEDDRTEYDAWCLLNKIRECYDTPCDMLWYSLGAPQWLATQLRTVGVRCIIVDVTDCKVDGATSSFAE